MKKLPKAARLVTSAGLALGSVMIAGPSVAEAGEPEPEPEPEFNLILFTQVVGAAAPDVLDGIEYELYPEVAPDTYGTEMKDAVTGGSCEQVDVAFAGGFALGLEGCDVLDGSYRLGISGVPDDYTLELFCDTGGFIFGAPEILEPGPTIEPDITIGDGSDVVSCLAVLYDDSPLTVDLVIDGAGHGDALAEASVEAYEDISADGEPPAFGPNLLDASACLSQDRVGSGGAFFFGPPAFVTTSTTFSCALIDGDYQLGVDGLAEGYDIEFTECFPKDIPFLFGDLEVILGEGAGFSLDSDPDLEGAYCIVDMGGPRSLYLDAVVSGGPAVLGDFGLEVFLDDGDLVGTVTDSAEGQCVFTPPDEPESGPFFSPFPTLDPSLCGALALADGDYELGATLPEYGYVVESTVCQSSSTGFGFPDERIGTDAAEFAHPVPGESGPFPPGSQCTVTFAYVEQTASASVAVTNDFGGDAVESDFTVEVFDSSGDLVDSAPAPATFTLPIGPYEFGVSGPDGYDTSIEVTIDDTPTLAFENGAGAFTLTNSASVTAVISALQAQPAPTTTTTTTTTTTLAPATDDATTTTTTTLAPTTAAPTTTVAPTTQLPATGSGNGGLLWWAGLLVLLGVGSIGLARRRSNMRW